MKLPLLPEPAIEPSKLIDSNMPIFGALYTSEQVQNYGQACREQALLDAMNATKAFGKTGEVIAVMIGALK